MGRIYLGVPGRGPYSSLQLAAMAKAGVKPKTIADVSRSKGAVPFDNAVFLAEHRARTAKLAGVEVTKASGGASEDGLSPDGAGSYTNAYAVVVPVRPKRRSVADMLRARRR